MDPPRASDSQAPVAGAASASPRRARWWLRAAVIAALVIGIVHLLPEDAPGPAVEQRADAGAAVAAGAPPPGPVAMADDQRAVRYVRSDLSSSALVRDYPSTEHGRVLTSLAPGTEIVTTGRVAGAQWQRVDLRGHAQAFVHGGLLSEEAPQRHAPRVAGPLEGAADTATLRVAAAEVRLDGIAPGTREPYATELLHFVADHAGEVDCTHVEDGFYRCRVGTLDLGEIILLNGAARTSNRASQRYLDNERVAREEGRGLWAP